MAKTIAELEIGTLVKDSGTIYNGVPIVFRIADKNHGGYPDNSVTLIADKIISCKCFDAAEKSNFDTNRKIKGSNRYLYSNIRKWLNSTASSGKWYSPAYNFDASPNNTNVMNGLNEYEAEAGFLNGFSEGMMEALLSTTLTLEKVQGIDDNGNDVCQDKIFLMSAKETGAINRPETDVTFPIFNSDASSRVFYPTPECVEKSEYKGEAFNPSKPFHYALRSKSVNSTQQIYYVTLDGSGNLANANTGTIGIVPLCNLMSSTVVSAKPDSEGIYTIIWGGAPTPPTDITVPETVNGGTNVEIIWGAATDADNDLTGYILERQHDEVVWEQIYKGANQNFKDTINIGWESVAYRVKAYDATDAESDYTTSETRSVINNTIPIISGDDENLGVKTGAFEYKYTITDGSRGQIITVTEEIDGKEKRNYTAVSGVENYLEVTNAEWLEILNGVHTLKITAENELGKAVRILTCSKNEKEIELTLSASLVTDDMLTKGNISVMGEIPEGAELSVKVCNNAKDEIPTWEDVTNAVIGGKNFCVDNITKTSENWSFNLKIKLNRKNAVGDCYIDLIRGNFE